MNSSGWFSSVSLWDSVRSVLNDFQQLIWLSRRWLPVLIQRSDLKFIYSFSSADWFSPTFSVSASHQQTEDVPLPVGVHGWGWWTGPASLTSVNIHLQCDKVGAVRWKIEDPPTFTTTASGESLQEVTSQGGGGDQSWWHRHYFHYTIKAAVTNVTKYIYSSIVLKGPVCSIWSI